MNPDVLIVGGGAAGLACGQRLAECGTSFRVLEAADRVGGHLRTDLFDGFSLDHSFPLVFAAAPESRRLLDVDALDLQPYSRAVLIRLSGRFHRMSDPRFEPFAWAASSGNPIGTVREKLRLIHFATTPVDASSSRAESLALDMLRWKGRFTSSMIDRFFRPLAGMLFHDRSLAVSSRLFRSVFAFMCSGPAGVPARGMQAIADQLAERLPVGSIRLNARVERIGHREVTLAGGESVRTRSVVDTRGSAGGRMCTIQYFAADRPPFDEPIILLNGDGAGPLNHVAVRKQLVAAGSLAAPSEELERGVRTQLENWFGSEAARWKRLGAYRTHLPDAASDQRPVRIRPGHYVCGEHTQLEGSFVSGFRAAQAALADLHADLT